MFAFLLSGVVAPQSHAACGSGNRMSPADAECLSAGYHSRSGWKAKKSTYWAENECSDHDKVVAKIDRSGVSDATWHLTTADRRSGPYMAAINGVYCCTDEGGICNKSDLTVSTCIARFENCEARDSCAKPSTSNTSVNDAYQCTIGTNCARLVSGGYNWATATGTFLEMSRLKNCEGDLSLTGCPSR